MIIGSAMEWIIGKSTCCTDGKLHAHCLGSEWCNFADAQPATSSSGLGAKKKVNTGSTGSQLSNANLNSQLRGLVTSLVSLENQAAASQIEVSLPFFLEKIVLLYSTGLD